jgi:hypothetical protein
MTEACLGLAMMTFTWIMMTYSFYMGNNQIRSLMAARYAAWFAGAGFTDSSDTPTEVTAAQLDQLFFFEPGLSKVETLQEDGIGSLLPGDASKFFADAEGPFKRKVTFGLTDLNGSTPFPFDLLKTGVPFMPSSMVTNGLSVSSSCQWDAVGATWRSAGAALKGILDSFLGPLAKVF